MPKSHSIYLNGKYYNADEPVLKSSNRAFLYGDALFETMLSVDGKLVFIKDHLLRLIESMQILKMRVPFNFNEDFFNNETGRLLRRDKFFKWDRVRATVFRNDGGLYTPASNEVSLLIESAPLGYDKFELNNEGFEIDAFTGHFKPLNVLSTVKSANALLFVLAGNYKKENNIDECIILNQKNFVCETISSNLFLVKDNKLFTPSLKTACLPGVMRKNIIKLARENGFSVTEVENLTLDHVAEADECFITNAIGGIRWVKSYRGSRFLNKVSAYFVKKLNEQVLSG